MSKKLSKAQKELRDFEQVFKALAHESRRRILVVLNARGGRMTAGEIVERFSCSWPTMTRHLKVLQNAELVIFQKEGRESIYIINKKKLNSTVHGWMSWFEE